MVIFHSYVAVYQRVTNASTCFSAGHPCYMQWPRQRQKHQSNTWQCGTYPPREDPTGKATNIQKNADQNLDVIIEP